MPIALLVSDANRLYADIEAFMRKPDQETFAWLAIRHIDLCRRASFAIVRDSPLFDTVGAAEQWLRKNGFADASEDLKADLSINPEVGPTKEQYQACARVAHEAKSMSRRNESVLEILVELPWWVSVIAACFVYIGVKFVVPSVVKGGFLFHAAVRSVSSYALWIAPIFLIPGAISVLLAWRKGDVVRRQTSLSTRSNLSWQSLEGLVSEVYRRDGYSIVGNSWLGSDGGIDLIARKEGETVLVQCKHWKTRKIRVRTVREMFGLLNAELANEVHVLTSGYFTDEARNFARNKPIRLIDGPMLVQLVRRAQSAAP